MLLDEFARLDVDSENAFALTDASDRYFVAAGKSRHDIAIFEVAFSRYQLKSF